MICCGASEKHLLDMQFFYRNPENQAALVVLYNPGAEIVQDTSVIAVNRMPVCMITARQNSHFTETSPGDFMHRLHASVFQVFHQLYVIILANKPV